MPRDPFGSLVIVIVVGLTARGASAHEGHQHAPPVEGDHGTAAVVHEMAAAAHAVDAALGDEPEILPAALNYELDAPHRTVADFFPRIMTERHGMTVGTLGLPARRAVHDLMRSGLSAEGYALVHQVMALEDHLRAVQPFAGIRDPGDYGVHIFGTPGGQAPWGWKLEGHHLSLNFTLAGDAVRSTPVFVGANPAEIRRGPYTGFRTLAAQDNLALALLRSLSAEQRAVAVAATAPPNEIVPRGGATTTADAPGLAAADMTAAQRHILHDLIASYARLLRPELGSAAMHRVLEGGWDHLHFRWRGGESLQQRHYYRIEGPTVVIEFDRIANAGEQDANHIHAIWHDPEHDYGRDLLAAHHEAHHAEGHAVHGQAHAATADHAVDRRGVGDDPSAESLAPMGSGGPQLD